MILIAAALCALVACEEEIDIRVGNETPVLLMNAQLHSDDTLHAVFLHTSLISRLEAYEGATVTVTVNETEKIEAQAVPAEESYMSHWRTPYAFRADFHPGDRVRIDAVRGADHAWAEVTFPEPGTIVSVDTLRVESPDNNEYASTYQFRVGIRDIPGKDSYYRLAIKARAESGDENDPAGAVRVEEQAVNFDNSADPAINEGRTVSESGEEDLLGELMPGNRYSAFTDHLFPDGDYTLRVDASRYIFLYSMFSETDVRHYAVVKLYTMSLSQYRYLRAIDNFDAFGYEMSFLVEPTSLPSNVEGGIGFVSAETCVERRLEIPGEAFNPIYYSPLTSDL